MTKQTCLNQWAVISAHLDFTDVNRGDPFYKRRSLMEAWGNFASSASKSSDVIALHKATAS